MLEFGRFELALRAVEPVIEALGTPELARVHPLDVVPIVGAVPLQSKLGSLEGGRDRRGNKHVNRATPTSGCRHL